MARPKRKKQSRRVTLAAQRKRLREKNRPKIITPVKAPPIKTGPSIQPKIPSISIPKPKKPKVRTIRVNTRISGSTQVVSLPESVRGSFEAGTERLVKSEIIHLFIYDIKTERLYVQLTEAGKWKGYTYLNVTQKQFEAFRDAPSKGRHFNSDIKQHTFLRGKRI